MLTLKSFEDEPYGRIFIVVLKNPDLPIKPVMKLLNNVEKVQCMACVTRNIEFPALGAIVKDLEKIREVKEYFESKIPSETLKYRQFVGMAVRLKMEEIGFKKTGKRGNLGSISKWFTRAAIYEEGNQESE